MVYMPTEQDIINCKKMLIKRFNITDENLCKIYADRILHISYSIGGGYNIETLQQIADAMFKLNNNN